MLYVLNEQVLLGMLPIEVRTLLLRNLQCFRFRLIVRSRVYFDNDVFV